MHRDQLRVVIRPWIMGKPLMLFKFWAGYQPEGTGNQELGPEAVKGHRKGIEGEWEVLIHWRDTPPEEDSWEVAKDLVVQGDQMVLKYLSDNDLMIEVEEDDLEVKLETYSEEEGDIDDDDFFEEDE